MSNYLINLALGYSCGIAEIKKERKKKRKSKDEVKSKVIRSLVEGEVFENGELSQSTDSVRNCEEAIPMVEELR